MNINEKIVLIVDDDSKSRRIFDIHLTSMGFQTILANNGEQGIKLVKENIPSLIIMDIQMPVMDGIQAIKILRSELSTSKIPVIALTSYAMRGDKEKFVKAGFNGFISKPIDLNKLKKMVKKYLRT